MLIFMKIIHLMALGISLGFAVAKAILGARSRQQSAAIADDYRAVQMLMGRIGAWLLLGIWVSGLYLFWAIYDFDFASVDPAFHIKLLFVLLFTAANVAGMIMTARARRDGKLPSGPLMRRVGIGGAVTLVLSIVFAVVAFN